MRKNALRWSMGAAILVFVLGSALAQSNSTEILLRAVDNTLSKKNLRVDAIVRGSRGTTTIEAEVRGDNFRVRNSPESGAVRFIHAGGKTWISRDDGRTWEQSAPIPLLIRLLFNALDINNFRAGMGSAPVHFASLGEEKLGGERLLRVRLEPPAGKSVDSEQMPQFWITLADSSRRQVRRARTLVALGDGSIVTVDATYSKIGKVAAIKPPPSKAVIR